MNVPVAPPDCPHLLPPLWLCSAVGRTMKMRQRFFHLTLPLIAFLTFLCCVSLGDTTTPPVPAVAKKSATPAKTAARKKTTAHPAAAKTAPRVAPKPEIATAPGKSVVKPAVATSRVPVIPASRTTKRKPVRWVQTWDEPTFKDSTDGDAIEGEDLEVRKRRSKRWVRTTGPSWWSIRIADEF